jgi:acyl-coenzyme A synthetase/AMP-(fatty) acid ligase
MPKLVVHTLATLTAPLPFGNDPCDDIVWGTFYDIRRYGGLQIFLRALMGGGSMVLPDQRESIPNHVERLQRRGVSHISGTPSHWRRLIMSGTADTLKPRYIRLSGEIADQPILDTLRSTYGSGRIVHAFASTEAGVGFEVTDGLAGFPDDFVGRREGVEVRIENASLSIRSDRTALRYLNDDAQLMNQDGFVDTGDVVERRGGRFHFLGRRSGIINIGGMKVHPEEIETIINRHPSVAMSAVRARKNPIVGAVVAAEVVLKSDASITPGPDIEAEILSLCRQSLPPHKVPVSLRLVTSLQIAQAGKLSRSNA